MISLNSTGASGSTHEITFSPTGYMWVSQLSNSKLVRISTSNEAEYFSLSDGDNPHGMVFDTDGRFWVVLEGKDQIAEINPTTGSVIQRINLRVSGWNNIVDSGANEIAPHGLAIDHDGKTLWFTGKIGNVIGKLDTKTNVVSLYKVPTASAKPIYIKAGIDQKMWFTELTSNRVGSINSDGTITEYLIPSGSAVSGGARPIAILYDKISSLMWFSIESSDLTGKAFSSIDSQGQFTEYSVPTKTAKMGGIGEDADGNLWLVYNTPDMIARVRKTGKNIQQVDEYQVPNSNGGVGHRITLGINNEMWFTEYSTNQVGRIHISTTP